MLYQSISFTRGNKSFSLEPGVILLDDNTLDIKEDKASDGYKKSHNIKSKLLIIDGRLHSLFETSTRKPRQSANLNTGEFKAATALKYLKKNNYTTTLCVWRYTKELHLLHYIIWLFFLDHLWSLIKETRMKKRSAEIPARKRLLTIKIFTIIDYSIFNKSVASLFLFCSIFF